MKRFSELIKENICTTADCNQGNDVKLGVTNHLTPVNNIVTNLRNLFASTGLVFSVAEDGFSVKINSSQFGTEADVDRIIWFPVYQNQSVASYIQAQGLDKISKVNIGAAILVYFSPSDVKAANPAQDCEADVAASMEHPECAWPESLEEAELLSIVLESEDEEEIEKLTSKQIKELITAKDKVKAAKQLSAIVAQQVNLPQDYYFAGVKSSDGDESIALRWKYIKRRPHGKSTEVVHSLMNIFGTGDDAVWVGDFDKKAVYQLPEEVKKLIESILDLLDAEKTSDPCVYKIEDDKKDDKKEDKKDDKKDDSDDSEDDSSRGDDDSKEDKNNDLM